MSALTGNTVSIPEKVAPSDAMAPPAPVAFHYTQSDSFVSLLCRLGSSLIISTYQANKLLAVRAGDELWRVSTRFSCLCTLDPDYSFVPRWRPPFISVIAAEDRCHLNGLALVDSQPGYVTSLGTTDTRDGWHVDKPHGGCIMDVVSGESVSRGLSMPHPPRWHDGRLGVLESGTGGVILVDLASGRREAAAHLPGLTRGLAFAGFFAFVGLSKIRPTSAVDGVRLAAQREQLKCGVAVVDIRTGQTVAFLEFQTAVEEIFDVQILPGIRFPEVLGFQQEITHHTFVVPATENRREPVHCEYVAEDATGTMPTERCYRTHAS